MLDRKKREGFTLVELSLAIAFIGVLSVAVAVVTMNAVASYRRGLTLSRVNTVGMDLVRDFQSTIRNVSTQSAPVACMKLYAEGGKAYQECVDDNGYNLVSVTRYSDDITINNKVSSGVPIFGAFCTGGYSYIWNSGYYESDNASFSERTNKKWATLRYKDDNGFEQVVGNNKPFKLLRVLDASRGVCASAKIYESDSLSGGGISEVFDISTGYGNVSETPVDLLGGSGNLGLALYSLNVAPPAESDSGGNTFYFASFILGTVQGGVNILTTGSSCTPPNDYSGPSGLSYCAINKFSFAAQVNGR